MESNFLREVASDLLGRYGDNVSDVKMLFPSRRARLFFLESLSQLSTKPIWQPQWLSIDEIMCDIAELRMGERLRLISELYKVYKKYHRNENFDKFFFYGEMLLGDFDMVDKYRVDARQLFSNLSDIKEIEADITYMTERQLQLLSFWSSINSKDGSEISKQKLRFLEVWQSLYNIYCDFRTRLQELGIGYAGMIHRKAVEQIEGGNYQFEGENNYAIVGFNALSHCEKSLFRELKNSHTTLFYWDYDNYYTQSKEQEAGLFISQNIKLFPSALNTAHDHMQGEKIIEAVACSSSTLQCRYTAQIIKDIQSEQGCIDKRTAIILTDESLLLPMLYALPEDVGEVNVTMGYPLMQTLAYSLLERLLKLQQNARWSASSNCATFYHIDVVGLLHHPYIEANTPPQIIRQIEREVKERRLIRVEESIFADDEVLTLVFKHINSSSKLIPQLHRVIERLSQNAIEEPLYGEKSIGFLDYIGDQILILHNNITQCDIEMSPQLMTSLLRRHIQSLRIPFEGEPLQGLQVMGILETRTLDFENVIILSMTDDNFPGNSLMQPSYIPYNLRMAHELPTPEHHDGVYAYYFYRLIQRAKRVSMLYCSRSDDKSTGEQSRYITQLDFESKFDVRHINVGVDVVVREREPIIIEKKGRILQQLKQFLSGGEREQKQLSPTMLFNYVVCPMRFYFKAIASIKEQEELEDDMDAPMFGNILHHAMQELYEPLCDATSAHELLARIDRHKIEKVVIQAINKKSLCRDGENLEQSYSGNLLLVKDIVCNYIQNGILRYDLSIAPFIIRGVEKEVRHTIKLPAVGELALRGICDREDELQDGTKRIVDYKTGSSHLDFKSIEALFKGEAIDRKSNIFQALLYSYIFHEKYNGKAHLRPALYYVRKMADENYSPDIMNKESKEIIEDYASLHEVFSRYLHEMLTEVFDERIPFTQCEDRAESCKYCSYKAICGE